jgi:uncharacterized membrane protein
MPLSTPGITRQRILSIDLLRGLVMIVMALDHTRDFFHLGAPTSNPLDLHTTTPILFFTRWITHFCAPVFVFLAGTSAYLMGLRRTKAALSKFLIQRGFWLILVEVVIVTFAWSFNPFYNMIILQVIWAIGISMVILGLAILLPYPAICCLAILIVFGHNMLDYAEAAKHGQVGFWWDLIHHANFTTYQFAPHHFLLIAYAFLPWTGIMLAGYAIGKIFGPDVSQVKRKKFLIISGVSLIVLFVVLRWTNIYGDPHPWTTQRNGLYTFLDFIKVNKYPPSLLYFCMTIGPALILLVLFEKANNRATRVINIYGRVPFFYYVLHLYVIHIVCVIAFFLSGYTTKDITTSSIGFFFRPDSFGFPLWGVYIVWISIVAALYLPCRWYNNYKNQYVKTKWWLSYL